MTLELFGMARALVGSPTVTLDLPDGTSLRGVLGALAARYPRLIGEVLEAQSFTPIEPNLVLLDGRRATSPDEPISDADKPCLLFLPSGG